MKNMQTDNQNQPKASTDLGSRRSKSNSSAYKVLLFLIIILVGVSFYFYRQYSAIKADPQADVTSEVEDLVAEVSRYMVLPDEIPTVATVTDIDKLKDQAFFANAKNGDKVLIFTQAKKAVLFDPVAKKIVEVAPINIGDGQTRATPKPTPQPVTPEPVEEEASDSTPTP